MTATGRQSVVGAVAALAAGVPLASLTEDRTFLMLGLLLVLLSLTVGLLARRTGAGEGIVRFFQLAPALVLPLLVPAARDPLRLYTDTTSFVQVAFAPMPFQIGFALFCSLLIWLVYLLVETLSIGLASPGWTFPVLALPYLIPSLALYMETSPFLFAFPAAGYALVLATATRNTMTGPPGTHETTTIGWRRGVATTATLSTALALTGAMLVSLPIPERTSSVVGGGPGAVQLGDPSLDLIRNINAPSDRTVITYRTSDNAGQYLRLAALPVFDAAGFHLTATDLVPLQFGGDLPRVATPGTVRTSIQIGQLDGEYLPMPWYPVAADVSGENWRYDPRTLAVVAIGRGRETATRNLTYQTTNARLPAAETLLPTLATAGDPGDGGLTLQLPPQLSPAVRQLALDVTARSSDSAGAKALALADFLRSGAFQYSTAVSPGTTLGTLDDFLLGSRIGYCEQFAASLAVMSRVVGVPSRVVVGFLPGKREGNHWEVSSRNMHAWVELYFGEGVGWVPVDPTPAGAVSGGPSASATPSKSPSASIATPTVSSAATPSVLPPLQSSGAGGGDVGGALPWIAGALVLVGVAAAGPRLTRSAMRRARLGPNADPRRASERAWTEVRAAARDRGRSWPQGTTREVAARFGADLDTEGRAALGALALTVERARYDNDPVATTGVAGQVAAITRAIEKRWASPTAGIWWPRSLWPRRVSS